MALYIARHGQTDWNASGRYQARTDVPINSIGVQQGELLRDLFRSLQLEFVSAHCSPLSRAVDTARLMLGETKTPLVVEDALVEMNLGDWEGRRADDLVDEFGDVYHRWRADGYVEAPHGGESIHDVMQRVGPTIQALAAAAESADILVVAHQATNMGIKAALSGDTSPSTLGWYRQSNDEVDVWDNQTKEFGQRLTVNLKPDS